TVADVETLEARQRLLEAKRLLQRAEARFDLQPVRQSVLHAMLGIRHGELEPLQAMAPHALGDADAMPCLERERFLERTAFFRFMAADQFLRQRKSVAVAKVEARDECVH